MRSGSRYSILRLSFAAVLLAGCGFMPTAATPPSSATPSQRATAILIQPGSSASSPSASVQATTVRSTAITISPDTPATATPPALVDRLALDQTWLWTQSSACNHRGGSVLAMNSSGALQQLNAPVLAIIERSALPPVLITCPADDQYAFVESGTWTVTPFVMPAGTIMQSFLASPDGSQVVFTTSVDSLRSGRKSTYSLALANIKNGTVQTLLDGDSLLNSSQVHYFGDLIEPIAWNGQTLYTHTQTSASSAFWAINLAEASPEPREVLVIGETGPWAIAPDAHTLVWNYSGQPLTIRDLRSGHDQVLRPSAIAASHVLISPDSHVLALVEADANQRCCELRLYDLTADPPQPIGAAMEIGEVASFGGKLGGQWSHDSRYLMLPIHVQADASIQVLVLSRNAQVIGTVPLADDNIDDMQLLDSTHLGLIAQEGAQSVVRSISFDASAPPSSPTTILPKQAARGMFYSIIHTP